MYTPKTLIDILITKVTSKFSNYQTDDNLEESSLLGFTLHPFTLNWMFIHSFFILCAYFSWISWFCSNYSRFVCLVGVFITIIIILRSFWESSFLQLEITISDIADYWTCFLINWLWLYLHTGGWLWGDYFQNLKLFLLHLFVRITT